MRRFFLLLPALLPVLASAQTPQLDYIAEYAPLAVSEMQRTGVPASITLAQGLLESGAGQSPLAVHANNHFGIKCHSDWEGETFYKDDDGRQECFRAYRTVEDSFRAHSDFLRNRPRYQSLFELEPTDYQAWARGLKKAGYATDPSYADKLIKQIEDYQLDRFDREETHVPVKVKEKEASARKPSAAKRPKQQEKQAAEPPVPPVRKQEGIRYDETVVLPI
ncbi:MAG: glucosaminidase domain-containing protein [Bacteroidales bacterium]|nr:glucosaminidase domain-containing protein [Bacteroidales bacterium]